VTEPSLEDLLADFRVWLQQAVSSFPESGTDPFIPSDSREKPIDLHTLLGQFLALRHEVNLQTKAVRSQQEQNAETLRQLTQALQTLHQDQATDELAARQVQEDQVRLFLKTLVELHDALAPAQREVDRLSRTLEAELSQLAAKPAPHSKPRKPSWWKGFLGKREGGPAVASDQKNYQPAPAVAQRVRQLLGSVLAGYTMSVQRLERAIQQQGLEVIACAGQPFDPEQMEAVEVVTESGRPGGEVIEEVRPGYLWNGRVFRFALVRVAKP
jgi:molecular chaperone GrpE